MDISNMTASKISAAILSRDISAMEVVGSSLEEIKKNNNELNAFITVDEEGALQRAKEVQELVDKGELSGPLVGVPVAVKDNICTKGIKTTCASRMLENYIPTYSATVIERLEQQGGIVIGKTNMDEFSMGSTTETSYYGGVKNPYNTDCVAGGSSGGSAVAVAKGMVPVALGSDTGGSIRQPSSYCNVVGIKPTYGSVSRSGLIAYASSLDQIGAIGRNVRDAVSLLETVSGYDYRDSTSIKRSLGFSEALVNDVKGIKIGVPKEYFGEGLDMEVKTVIMQGIDALSKMGAEVEEFSMPYMDYGVAAYYLIASAEASSNLGRYDGVKYGYRAKEYEGLHNMYKRSRSEGFGSEVKRRIMLGTFVLSAGYYDVYYLKALKTKNLIRNAMKEAFSKYDVIISPVAPTTAPRFGYYTSPMEIYLSDIYSVTANLAGIPAVSVPVGMSREGMPIGMQLMGDSFREDNIIRVAYTFEQRRREYEQTI